MKRLLPILFLWLTGFAVNALPEGNNEVFAVEKSDVRVREDAKGGKLKPEAKYLGSKKHGVNWTEGPATAKNLKKPQGQWGSKSDLDFAGDKAGTLKSGEGSYFELPAGHSSKVHTPDGSTVNATHIWVRNNGTGTFHGYPLVK